MSNKVYECEKGILISSNSIDDLQKCIDDNLPKECHEQFDLLMKDWSIGDCVKYLNNPTHLTKENIECYVISVKLCAEMKFACGQLQEARQQRDMLQRQLHLKNEQLKRLVCKKN